MAPNRPATVMGLLILALGLVLSGCEQPNQLERIRERGELIVATRHAPTSYYRGADGPEGLEYRLVSNFARAIGVKARFVLPSNLEQLLQQVARGEVHMAAAGLTHTQERSRWLRFSHPYQEIKEYLVYRRGSRKPRSLADVQPGELHIVAGSSHGATLETLSSKDKSLTWTARSDLSGEQLLKAVDQGRIRYTVVDSNELAMAQRVFRHLKPALDLSDERQLAWAFPAAGDDSLVQAANDYLDRIRFDGTLEGLLQRLYAHADRLDFVTKRDLQRHIRERLPRLKPFFREASQQTSIDWLLLAAIGYQESHWNGKAVSPTGVRGVMMLTASTAKQLGVTDRSDPRQSILGGARYLRLVEKKIPARIPEPHRLWLALAGYNVGFGHLEDARVLTQRQGGDPDRWQDVRDRLPLLRKKRYYQGLKHGRANGVQAVEYVENVRSYYDLLVWFHNHPDDLEPIPDRLPAPTAAAR